MKILGFFKKYWVILLVIAVFITHTIINFYGQFKYHYPVAPGGDMVTHLKLINDLVNSFSIDNINYPPLLHMILATVVRLTGYDTLVVTAYALPVLIVISGLSVWLLATKIYGKAVGVAAYLLYALVSIQPLQTAYDGGLPNIFGGHIILPLLIIFYVKLWGSRGWKILFYSVLSLVSILLILLSHHLSSLIAIEIIFSSFPFLIIWRLINISQKNRVLSGFVMFSMYILLLLIIFSSIKLKIFSYANNLASLFISFKNTYPFIIINHREMSPPPPIAEYGNSLSGLVFYGGLFGTVLALFISFFKKYRTSGPATIVLFCWAVSLFAGSQMSWVGEPGRLMRDLSLPLSIMAGYVIVWFFGLFRGKHYITIILLVITSCLIYPYIVNKAIYATQYNRMVFLSKSDEIILNDLASLPCHKPIYVAEKSDFWKFLASKQIEDGRIIFIKDIPSELKGILKIPNVCILLDDYKPGVTPQNYNDEKFIKDLGTNPKLKLKYLLEDQQKTWYLLINNEAGSSHTRVQ